MLLKEMENTNSKIMKKKIPIFCSKWVDFLPGDINLLQEGEFLAEKIIRRILVNIAEIIFKIEEQPKDRNITNTPNLKQPWTLHQTALPA